jgi:hypothetical protein
MPWDDVAAEKAGEEFRSKLREDMPLAELRQLWQAFYMKAGHKLLARILIEKKTDAPVPASLPE